MTRKGLTLCVEDSPLQVQNFQVNRHQYVLFGYLSFEKSICVTCVD